MKHKLRKANRYILTILVTISVIACDQSKESTIKNSTSQLNELLSGSSLTCKDKLLEVGNKLVGEKKHFFHQVKPLLTIEDNNGNNPTTKTALHTLQTEQNITLAGTLNYNDRPSHILIQAYPTIIDGSGTNSINNTHCTINYELNYQLDTPCVAAREEAFKKWLLNSSLGETQSYVHKRDQSKIAYLTNINRNTQCLVRIISSKVL